MIVVRIADIANTNKGAFTGPAASKKSTGSPNPPLGTSPIPSPAQLTSKSKGSKDPSTIASRIEAFLYRSILQTVGKISQYTRSCRNVGIALGSTAQVSTLLEAFKRDQSVEGSPAANSNTEEMINTLVRAELRYGADVIPRLGPNTAAPIDRATVAHPIRYIDGGNNEPARDIWLTSVASVSTARRAATKYSPLRPKADLAVATAIFGGDSALGIFETLESGFGGKEVINAEGRKALLAY